MSVIMGIKTNDIVILGADKRLSTLDGKKVSDDGDKILVINSHLAIACAGNAAIQKALEGDVNKLGISKESLYVEDVTEMICNLFKKLEGTKTKLLQIIISSASQLIVGGLNKNNEMKLLSFSYLDRNLHWSEVKGDMIIFPPPNVTMKDCAEIFVRNLNIYPEYFIEKTVFDVSKISAVVSKNGNKWIYDNRSKMSEKRNFDKDLFLGYTIKKRMEFYRKLLRQRFCK